MMAAEGVASTKKLLVPSTMQQLNWEIQLSLDYTWIWTTVDRCCCRRQDEEEDDANRKRWGTHPTLSLAHTFLREPWNYFSFKNSLAVILMRETREIEIHLLCLNRYMQFSTIAISCP